MGEIHSARKVVLREQAEFGPCSWRAASGAVADSGSMFPRSWCAMLARGTVALERVAAFKLPSSWKLGCLTGPGARRVLWFRALPTRPCSHSGCRGADEVEK